MHQFHLPHLAFRSSARLGLSLALTASLIRAFLAFGSGGSASGAVLLRFRPRFPLSAEASSAFDTALFGFRPRFPLPLASLPDGVTARKNRSWNVGHQLNGLWGCLFGPYRVPVQGLEGLLVS